MFKMKERNMLLVMRIAVAVVWVYEGVWCKLLERAGGQRRVIAGAPFLMQERVGIALAALGALECTIAIWVLSGVQPVGAAMAQTVVLTSVNAGGLMWSRGQIHDPAGMVVRNFALLALAWATAMEASNGCHG
ncbi:MAG TPA: DoxX-like family protein [Bryobacteraceae bacterium]